MSTSVGNGEPGIEPFVALMRRYCIDYTNSHDLSVCDSIMEPDYVVRICGMELERDASYKPSVETVFRRFPALGLTVHDLVTNGERLAMRFSEHAATADGTLACWSGIGLYEWNGARLTGCRVEQDFWSQRRQLDTGVPDPLESPHIDPWLTTTEEPCNPEAEEDVHSWLAAGDLATAESGRIDERAPSTHQPVISVESVEVLDLFSAGQTVAFHARLEGGYTGGLGDFPIGAAAAMYVAGMATVDRGRITDVHVVTDRFGLSMALASAHA
jgi:hypothetical protein